MLQGMSLTDQNRNRLCGSANDTSKSSNERPDDKKPTTTEDVRQAAYRGEEDSQADIVYE
jgi:hypothetical protein